MNNNKNTFFSGASKCEIENAINAFLTNTDINVLAIKGTWGIGKTYLVKQLLHKSNKSYHYGTVFGLSTLDDLRNQLLSNYKDSSTDGNQVTGQRLSRIVRNSSKHIAKYSKFLEKIPKANAFFPLTSDIMFSGIRNTIICIDDIERKSKKLDLDELLGFIEFLVEERQCKILLIYNEEHIEKDKEAIKTLNDYREKVIDSEIRFAPSVEENYHLVFGDNYKNKHTILNTLRSSQTNNIRVLKKIHWIIEKFSSFFQEWENSIIKQFVINVISIALAKFDSQTPIDIQLILDENEFSKSFDDMLEASNSGEKVDDPKKRGRAILRQLKYSYLPFDEHIIQVIETHSFDEESFLKLGQNYNDRELKHKIREKLTSIWDSYSNSFLPVEDKLSKDMLSFLDENISYLSLIEFESIESLMKAIGINMSTYKKKYFAHIIDNKLVKNLSDIKNRIREYPELIKKIEDNEKEEEESKNITDVLYKIVTTNGWSGKDEDFLCNRTVEQYSDWLKAEHSDKVSMIRQGLSMKSPASDRLKKAITILAKESPLNAMRAKYLYEVNIKDDAKS